MLTVKRNWYQNHDFWVDFNSDSDINNIDTDIDISDIVNHTDWNIKTLFSDQINYFLKTNK